MEANARALAAGTTTEKIFDMVRELRENITIPMVFMTYANVLFSYGSEAFICVSSLGATGTRGEITTDVGEMVARAKAAKDIPCAIGFGISTPEQAREMAAVADGVIVGSAIMKLIAAHGTQAAGPVGTFAKSLKKAITGA